MSRRSHQEQGAGAPRSFEDALDVLDGVLEEDPGFLGEAMTEIRHSLAASRERAADAGRTIRSSSAQAYRRAKEVAAEGLDKTKSVARGLDANVKRNPWPVLGGMALGAFAIGYWAGRRRDSR